MNRIPDFISLLSLTFCIYFYLSVYYKRATKKEYEIKSLIFSWLLNSLFHHFHYFPMLSTVQPTMLFCTLPLLWNQFSLNDFSDCFIDNITKLVWSYESVRGLLESWIINLFLNLISIILNFFLFDFYCHALEN